MSDELEVVLPPEPGEIPDLELGVKLDEDFEIPDDDGIDEPSLINDEEDEEDDDDDEG